MQRAQPFAVEGGMDGASAAAAGTMESGQPLERAGRIPRRWFRATAQRDERAGGHD